MTGRSTRPRVAGTAALALTALVEAEFAKDVWDVRQIPGARYKAHESDHLLNFTRVPVVYRPLVKRYIRHKLMTTWSQARCHNVLVNLRPFLLFWAQRAPDVDGFQPLRSADIDAYLTHLKATPNQQGRPKSAEHVWLAVNAVAHFLRYLTRIDSPLAPVRPIDTIVWPEHAGKRPRPNPQGMKHIPEGVLRQLNEHISALPAVYRPVVILLLASGWRIADVLNLRHDTCLEARWDPQRQRTVWDLVGDIAKTGVLSHHIPVTDEVATLVQAQRTLVCAQYTEEENPQRYLFPALRRKKGRTGRPLSACQIRYALNKLARECEIRGDDGQIFHVKAHAFRHTKAVELINSGMPLVYVQQWLAHLSPEMTAIYARIQADTMRTQWEKTTANGIVRFNDGQPAYVDGKKALTVLNDNAFDPLRVRENRVNVKMPLGTCTKTDKIVCRFFELPCFHCIAYVLTPDDLPALEAYEQEVVARIELTEANGQAPWAEFNRQNLETRIRPALTMLREGQTYAKGHKYDREYTPEEWAQRQTRRQQEGQA